VLLASVRLSAFLAFLQGLWAFTGKHSRLKISGIGGKSGFLRVFSTADVGFWVKNKVQGAGL